jgi:phosphoglycolate phosphatase-like HAD superfamily hydrolase
MNSSSTQPPFVVYVDVDDTMVRSVGTKRIPLPEVIEHVRQLKDAGATLYCWSTGGAEYARSTAREFRIEHCFEGFLPKPHVYIDDQELKDWRRCLWVNPSNCRGTSLKEYVSKVLGL